MSELLGTAFVSIQSELAKGFRANLRTQVLKAVGDGYRIPIKADIKPFRAQLQAEARKGPILVPVKPGINVAQFRAEVSRKLKAATKGLTVTVPVNVASRGRGGRGGAGGVSKETRDQQRLRDAIGRTGQAEGLLARARVKNLEVGEQISRLNRTIQTSESSVAALLKEETTARAANNTVLADAIAEQRVKIQQNYEEATSQKATLETVRTQTAVESRLATAKANASSLLAQDLGKIKTRDRLQLYSNDLLAAETELRKALIVAEKTSGVVIDQETRDLHENTIAREANIKTRRDELRAAERGAGRRAQGLRGAGATGLTFAGLRGATLAAGGPFLAGAAGVAIVAKSIQAAANLEKELNVLRITARATASQMEAVRERSIELGRDIRLPGVSAADAAVAMNQLVRAGLSVEDAIDGAEGVLQLGTAAEIDFADATNLVASALNAFQLAGTDATHVADLFTNAANASQASIEEMGISLQQASAAAAITGISLDDTVALLTLLSRAGLRGSDAGTSLRTALIRLVNPTKEASNVIRQLGLNVRDSQGAIRPEVFGEFSEATENLTRQQRQQAAAIIFGADAFRTIAITSREGVAGLERVRTELERTGSAAELAGARAQGFSGQISALSSNLETLGTNIASVALPPLTAFLDELNSAVSDINAAVTGVKNLAAAIGDLGDELDKLPGGSRLRGIFDFVARQGGNRLRAAVNPIPAPVRTAVAGTRAVGRPFGLFEKETKKAGEAADEARVKVELLFRTFGEGPLKDESIRSLVTQLEGVADELSRGDAEAQELARSIREIITEIGKTGSVPSIVEIQTKIDTPKAIKDGTDITNFVLQGIRGVFPEVARTGSQLIDIFGDAAKKRVTEIDLGGAIAASVGSQLSASVAVAEAAGDEAGQLSGLRQLLARREAFLERINARVARDPSPKNVALQERAAQNVTQTQNAIQAILDEQRRRSEEAARDAEETADKIATAQEKRDQAVLEAFGRRQQGRENLLEVAQATEGLADDIAATIALRKLIIKQRDSLRERIKTHELRVEARREYNQRLFELGQELAALRLQRKRTIQEEIRRGIELDIEFAETTENAAAERRARLALIKSLNAEAEALRAVKKKSIEQRNRLKEIRNEIAAQRKELQEITQDRKKMFAEMSFAFLTTQQGFFANVAGNLLPGFATIGAVGAGPFGGGPGLSGGSSGSAGRGGSNIAAGLASFGGAQAAAAVGARGFGPQDALDEGSRRAQANASGGFTAAQASTLIHLTHQIVKLLGGVESRTRHPEAKNSARSGGSSMDAM